MNLQAPFERTSIGIDSLDLELDLLVTPELDVFVKDEEHVDRSAALGRFTTEDGQRSTRWAPPAGPDRARGRLVGPGVVDLDPTCHLRVVPRLVEGWERVRGTVFAELAGR